MMNLLFGVAQAAETTTENTYTETTNPIASLVGMVLPLLLMVLIFYFMLIRPQRKKDKKVKEMLNALKPGDLVTTIGGIFGTIVSIRDDRITLAIGQKNAQATEMTVARWAIRQVEEVTVENDGEILA